MEKEKRLALLRKTQECIKVERILTATLDKVEPWLPLSNTTINNTGKRRVRPTPTTMEEVKQILAVGRNYSSRTSAPAGWNPNAPVVGFSTPSPLPHMLRGGALAALQLEGAKQAAESDKKRKREEMEKAKKQQQEADSTNQDNKKDGAAAQAQAAQHAAAAAMKRRSSQQQQRQSIQVKKTTMNLSDSDEDDDDESDDSDE